MKNNEKDVKTIGLILEDIYTDFAQEVILGVLNAVKARGGSIRLVLLAGRQNELIDFHDKMCLYKTVYNSIYLLEEKCPFDGLILTLPKIFGEVRDAVTKEHFSNLEQLPKVFLATKKENEITINYDNESGIREAIDYLVKIRGVTKICMLGGRDDNADASERKGIFRECLLDNRLEYSDQIYEKTDMSVNSIPAAERLLDKNPDVQAVFCVNDPVAVALYAAMEKRGLVPGKDIMVFGFDNTRMSSQLVPPLASIGPDDISIGQKALNTLMEVIEEGRTESVVIPTRLYGRESCPYKQDDNIARDLEEMDDEYIYRLFDECFYRYKYKHLDGRSINLRKLFYEIVSRMLYSMRSSYMSVEKFDEITRMIGIFFENGAMNYTDVTRFLQSISKLQAAINIIQKSVYANVKNNRLLEQMRNSALQAVSGQKNRWNNRALYGRGQMLDFLIETMDFGIHEEETEEVIFQNFDKLGLKNAALYLFDKPMKFVFQKENELPEKIRLRCVMKSGELYVLPDERQLCKVSEMFFKKELPIRCNSYMAFPVFYGSRIYGYLVCELTMDIPERGEYMVSLLSRVLYVKELERRHRSIKKPMRTEPLHVKEVRKEK